MTIIDGIRAGVVDEEAAFRVCHGWEPIGKAGNQGKTGKNSIRTHANGLEPPVMILIWGGGRYRGGRYRRYWPESGRTWLQE